MDRKIRARHLVIVLLLACAVFLAFKKYIDVNVNQANASLVRNDYQSAETYFSKVANLPFSKGKGQDGLGALDLLLGDMESARAHFKSVLAHKPNRISGDPSLILGEFIGEGAYLNASIYVDFLKNWKTETKLIDWALDFAAVALGNRDLAVAGDLLGKVLPKDQKSERFTRLQKSYQSYTRKGLVPVLLDRNGQTYLHYNTKDQLYQFTLPEIFAGWMLEGNAATAIRGLSESEQLNQVGTTLDLKLQKAAYQAMGGYKGTLLLSDPSTGEVLAAFGSDGYDPFQRSFQPGSVMKLLTYGLFLENGGDPTPYAPKNYAGFTSFGGKIFYDWTQHGRLASINEGMAVSCNLMFAQMGIDLSLSKWLKGVMDLYDGSAKPGFLRPASFGHLLREPQNAWQLGKASIGLNHLETTALGADMIAMAVANSGKLYAPYLIRNITNIDQESYFTRTAQEPRTLFAPHVTQKIFSAMVAAVTSPKGTARRARVDFVQAAMKTGTTGDKPLNSVMVGFFPTKQPKLTFALFLHEGGKCQTNGALVAGRLQEQIKAQAPDYLK